MIEPDELKRPAIMVVAADSKMRCPGTAARDWPNHQITRPSPASQRYVDEHPVNVCEINHLRV
ncbi:MAG TPA: hypothetical protein VN748_08100 [Pseudonocardiaceae bacterium]|nr:hypothetical protein [Pseudonocardiaceae bacterium]